MPPASPARTTVTIRRHQPIADNPRAVDEVLCDEAGLWGLYGDIVSQRVDDARHAITEVAPRRRGGWLAIHRHVETSRDHTLHQEAPHAPTT